MLDIIKFTEFLNEAKIYLPIIDVVIDSDGNVHNGDGYAINKGRVERKTKEEPHPEGGLTAGKKRPRKITVNYINQIQGTLDGKDYPAGIDKNGNLLCVAVDDENYALNRSGERIRMSNKLKAIYVTKYWKVGFDYTRLIPIIPTGWVNVKIDMEIVKRVRRFSTGLGNNKPGFENFLLKLSEFQKISKNQKGKIINDDEFMTLSTNATSNIKNLKTQLDNLVRDINK